MPTDDGALIYYETRGAVWLTVGDQQRLAKGERFPFGQELSAHDTEARTIVASLNRLLQQNRHLAGLTIPVDARFAP